MNRINTIGLIIIMILVYIWATINAPTQEELDARKRAQDSISQITQQIDPQAPAPLLTREAELPYTSSDTTQPVGPRLQAGRWLPADRQEFTLSNDLLTVRLDGLGGRIRSADIRAHKKVIRDSAGVDHKIPLFLQEDEKNKWNIILPLRGGAVETGDIVWEGRQQGSSVDFIARLSDGGSITQRYTLAPEGYTLDHEIFYEGLGAQLTEQQATVQWIDYLDKLERNDSYERNYSTIYFKEIEEDVDNCSCTGSDDESPKKKVEWISHSNQFFNSTLMTDQALTNVQLETEVLDADDEDLKKLSSTFSLPTDQNQKLHWYIGPNDYETLADYDKGLEYIIPYGSSIFGTINRYMIRPLFNLLGRLIGNYGIVILLLTLLIKFLLYPLMYKMLSSQARMAALKPEVAEIQAKYGDDKQGAQMAIMKMYGEYGVSMAQGCLPMLLQMPIWFALYRFFPGNIDLRQHSFLWATDLSSYEEFIRLPFEIPFYGSHISLFAILWALSVLWYSWYNMRHMDMTASMGQGGEMQKMMKYMQYFMPLSFVFFFNNFASGLTLYMMFSSIINIGQVMGTKKLVLDENKLRAELEAKRKENLAKPKKKGGFRERLEQARKQQLELQKQQQLQKSKKTKKR